MPKLHRFLALSLFSVALPLSAMPPESLPESLSRMKSADSSVRIAAFYDLFNPPLSLAVTAREGTLTLLRDHPDDRKAIVQSLVDLLTRENSLINGAPAGSLPESYGEYHASLIWSVATLHDGKATDALLGAIKTGRLASDGLVALGATAMPAIIRAAGSPDSAVRVEATMILGEMAMQSDSLNLDIAHIGAIRTVLLHAVGDEQNSVRLAAVLSLDSFVDSDVHATIERSATIDGSERVREVANEWLKRHRME